MPAPGRLLPDAALCLSSTRSGPRRLSAIEYSKFRFEVVVIEPGLSLVALSGEPQVVDDFGPVVICRPLNRRHAPAF